MTSNLHIQFLGMPRSETVEADVGKHVARLEKITGRAVACNVTIEATTRRKQQGRPYCVHVEARVPGAEVVSNRHQDADPYVAVRDAFAAVERALSALVQRRRDDARRPMRVGSE